MTVKIEIYGEDAGHAIRELRDLSAGFRAATANDNSPETAGRPSTREEVAQIQATAREAETEPAEAVNETPKRERGKPAPGRSRRTKVEIAEDEAAEAMAAAVERANISTDPENRVDPENADDPETEAQDAADEKAEFETTAKELTREDVKGAMTAYVKKYGMEATQEDGPKIFLEALGKPPSGEDYWKLSLLPDDQDALSKVIDTWNKATELNPLKREVVGA